MNSPIELPPLSDLPEPDLVGVSHSPDGDEAPIFEWDEEKLKAWATAYAEQAVRDALAAQVSVAWMDEFGNVELSYKPWMDDEPGIVWRPLAIIPENNHE